MGEFEETFDFVVVGSGGGSMCAALVMKTAGEKTLILEKTDLVGGSTAMAGGVMWIPNNGFLKVDGVEDSPEKAATYLDSVVGDAHDAPGAPREKRLAYIDAAPRMVDFLMKQGIRLRRYKGYPDYYDNRPGGMAEGRTVVADLFNVNELGDWKTKLRPNFLELPAALDEVIPAGNFKQTWEGKFNVLKIGMRMITQKLTGKHWVTAGNALQGRMLQAALKAGVSIRTNAPVRQILTDAAGKVTGVVAHVEGRERRIGARCGVLINAGGFARNQAMRDKYQPGTHASWSNACPGDTGEMIEEAARVGAAIGQMEEMIGCLVSMPPEERRMHAQVQNDITKPHSILVDRSGVRFVNESQSYMELCQEIYERHKTVPAAPGWGIFDSQYIRKYMLAESMPGAKKPKEWFASGFLRQADTIEELAALCGMEPATLRSTIDRFNAFASIGRDEDFHRGEREYDRWLGDLTHKPSPSLGAIAEAPYYAMEIYAGDVGTFGGIVTDSQARALRSDGSVIEGLYATGTSTAAVMGRTYPGAGCSIGPAFTFGFIAANHAIAHSGCNA